MRVETPHKLWSMAGELNSAIVGSVIKNVWAPHWSFIRFERAKKIAGQVHPDQLIGWYFSSVETHGKSLLLKLENFGIGNRYIGCNLGQGAWMLKPDGFNCIPWSESIQVVFIMTHPKGYDYQLMFYDRRHNGKLEIRDRVHELEILNRYGPPIDSPYFTLDWVRFVVANSNRKHKKYTWKEWKEQPFHLKSLLLRQEYFAGLTNKMVSEICFLANLYPDGLARDLNDDQVERLYMSVLVIFSTFSRHRDHHEFMIWGRYNCPVCNAAVKTYMTYNLRTYYCPDCQDPDFKKPQPISTDYVEQVLKITRNMEYVKNGIERWNEKQSERVLSANVSETKS